MHWETKLKKGLWKNGEKQSKQGQKGEICSSLFGGKKKLFLFFQDELMYMLRKLLLNIGDFPAQTSHILFNYLVSSLWAHCGAQNLFSAFMCAINALNFSYIAHTCSWLWVHTGFHEAFWPSGERKRNFSVFIKPLSNLSWISELNLGQWTEDN